MHYDTFWYENYEYRCDIMTAIVERLNNMVHRFARVFVVRLDITFPTAYRSTGTSEEISKLMKRLVEIYTDNPSDPAKRVMMHYVVVREQKKDSNNPHYHLVTLTITSLSCSTGPRSTTDGLCCYTLRPS
jgi:hypothetical protein